MIIFLLIVLFEMQVWLLLLDKCAFFISAQLLYFWQGDRGSFFSQVESSSGWNGEGFIGEDGAHDQDFS